MADGTATGKTLGLLASMRAGAADGGVVPWFYKPAGEVLERLEWLTDVLPSFDGGEQRRALRQAPRRSFEFELVLTDADRRFAENRLQQLQSRLVGVPVWPDAQPLPAAITAGATTITINTETRDFEVGGLVGIATGPRAFEVIEIDSVAAGSLGLAAPLAASWPAGSTEIFPVRLCRLSDEVSLRRFTGATSYGVFRFDVDGPSDWPEASETTYRGLPVLGQAPNWTEDIESTFRRLREIVDGGTGPVFVDDRTDGPIIAQSHRWLLDGRTEIDTFRRWLYARRGRLAAFWLPTFALDLAPVATINSAATTIDVQACDYVPALAQGINRRDIRIEVAGGTVYHRRITGAVVISSSVERLTINAALGATVDPGSVVAVSYMAAVRLAADAVEIAWRRSDLAESSVSTQGNRNDV